MIGDAGPRRGDAAGSKSGGWHAVVELERGGAEHEPGQSERLQWSLHVEPKRACA